MLAINHSIFMKGDQTYFEIEPSFGVEASELYPDVKYTTVEEYLDQFVWVVDLRQKICEDGVFLDAKWKRSDVVIGQQMLESVFKNFVT